jgi:hypothetical protein
LTGAFYQVGAGSAEADRWYYDLIEEVEWNCRHTRCPDTVRARAGLLRQRLIGLVGAPLLAGATLLYLRNRDIVEQRHAAE